MHNYTRDARRTLHHKRATHSFQIRHVSRRPLATGAECGGEEFVTMAARLERLARAVIHDRCWKSVYLWALWSCILIAVLFICCLGREIQFLSKSCGLLWWLYVHREKVEVWDQRFWRAAVVTEVLAAIYYCFICALQEFDCASLSVLMRFPLEPKSLISKELTWLKFKG